MATLTAYSPPPSSLTSSTHIRKPTEPNQPADSQQQQLPPWRSHAVNRTNELLSCARTAFKIAQQKRRQFQQSQQHQQQSNGNSNWKKSKEDGDLIPEWMLDLNPNDLTLYVPPPPSFSQLDENDGSGNNNNSTQQQMKDAQSLLKILDSHLEDLHSLVRRRGHTNDPTLEIQSLLEKFQSIGVELKEGISALRSAGTTPIENNSGEKIKSSGQRRRHYELLSDRLENDAKERMDKLKKELETRSQVLRDQNFHRRKLLGNTANNNRTAMKNGGLGGAVNLGSTGYGVGRTTSAGAGIGRVNQLPAKTALGAAASASQRFQSPLFTMTASNAKSSSSAPPSMNGNGTASSSSNKPPSYSSGASRGHSGYAGYGGAAASAAGYGGTSTAPSFSMGMRQRKQQQSLTQQNLSSLQIDRGHDNDDEDKYSKSTTQQQIQMRRQNRETQSRLASARLAEKSIAELGVMFTKMSTLISQQGEVLERIEDDVERAGGDIDAGHEEIVKLYGMTKGNRGLILKVFGILIFFIVFMKLY